MTPVSGRMHGWQGPSSLGGQNSGPLNGIFISLPQQFTRRLPARWSRFGTLHVYRYHCDKRDDLAHWPDRVMSIPMKRSTQPTINDVARVAGVSKKTVSRVINQSPLLNGETRRRVEEVIAELGYVPNPQARA